MLCQICSKIAELRFAPSAEKGLLFDISLLFVLYAGPILNKRKFFWLLHGGFIIHFDVMKLFAG